MLIRCSQVHVSSARPFGLVACSPLLHTKNYSLRPLLAHSRHRETASSDNQKFAIVITQKLFITCSKVHCSTLSWSSSVNDRTISHAAQ
nr:MAG TPA: hypothetical protein [Caudoviricetes sp.]